MDRVNSCGYTAPNGEDPVQAAQGLAVPQDFLGHFLGTADQQCAFRTGLGIKLAARDWRPASLLADLGERAGVSGEVAFDGFLCRLRDVAQRVQADFELIRVKPGPIPRLPVQIQERAKDSGAPPTPSQIGSRS